MRPFTALISIWKLADQEHRDPQAALNEIRDLAKSALDTASAQYDDKINQLMASARE